MKTSVLLINLGTPESPKIAKVRRYLKEFLNDSRVINISWLWRKLLVNFIIVPFRSFRSAKLYQNIWTLEGSPLLVNTQKLKSNLQAKLDDNYVVDIAMRYGSPSMVDVFKKIKKQQPERIIIIPLYPQYASSTTGSAFEKVFKLIGRWKNVPDIKIIHHFNNHEGFINAFAHRINQYKPQDYDHVIMSYHGLPMSHISDAHIESNCETMGCAEKRDSNNNYCYVASCYETSRLLAEKLSLKKEGYTVCFQSRLNKSWTKPFTDEVVKDIARAGKKRILVVSPAFVTDCLETIYELSKELKEKFERNGGTQLTLVESLNDLPQWVDVIRMMVIEA